MFWEVEATITQADGTVQSVPAAPGGGADRRGVRGPRGRGAGAVRIWGASATSRVAEAPHIQPADGHGRSGKSGPSVRVRLTSQNPGTVAMPMNPSQRRNDCSVVGTRVMTGSEQAELVTFVVPEADDGGADVFAGQLDARDSCAPGSVRPIVSSSNAAARPGSRPTAVSASAGSNSSCWSWWIRRPYSQYSGWIASSPSPLAYGLHHPEQTVGALRSGRGSRCRAPVRS